MQGGGCANYGIIPAMGVDRLERVNSLLKRVIAEAMFSVMQGDTVQPGLITVTGVTCGRTSATRR